MISKNFINILLEIINDHDVSVASVARRMEKSSQALNQQLNNNDIKISKFLDIVEALHCDIDIVITDRATGKKYRIDNKM